MMDPGSLNFLAIDFETANSLPESICEVGVCAVRGGEIAETRSWLVRPEGNSYQYWNMRVHGIRPSDTEDAPRFDEVWQEIERLYLDEFDTLVAHNVPFDRRCLTAAAKYYNLHLPALTWECSLAASRRAYRFRSYSLENLCIMLDIPEGKHHRAGDDAEMCARLYIKALSDMP